MLQQTQTATVIPYYEKFLNCFPTVETLAEADREEVLSLWAGLGYYRRAHLLHEAARRVAFDLGGHFPDTVEELLTLPGVGRYTAGAIASIAFGRRAPILDGNVSRVLARLFNIRERPDTPAVKARLWELAEAVLPKRNCGAFNQALMDLGATVCTPKNPNCPGCPLLGNCQAYRNDTVDAIPPPRKRSRVQSVSMTAFVVLAGDCVLLRQRSDDGLWAGMWELPSAVANGDEMASVAEEVLPVSMARRRVDMESIGSVEHQLTHRSIRFNAYRVFLKRVRLPKGYRWTKLSNDLPLPSAFKKVLLLATDG